VKTNHQLAYIDI